MEKMLSNETRREEIRLSFHKRQETGGYAWKQLNLQTILDALLNHETLNRDICLFLDALDEYDGEPEFIAGFLRHIQNRREDSRCRIRICFSGRPWNVFQRHFGSDPGFAIHKYTKDDISRYCSNSIDDRFPGDLMPLRSLVPLVTGRAKGVFVWVRLVLRDLFAVVANFPGEEKGRLGTLLKECLDSLPDELEEYYETIIDRIEETFRWDAYVVLEILSRAEETIRVNSVLEALAISKATTSRDAKRRLKKLDLADKLLEAKSRLMALSGSLIEFRVIRTQQPVSLQISLQIS